MLLGLCIVGGMAGGVAQAEDKVDRIDRELQALLLQARLAVAVPVGTIMAYGGDLAEPKLRASLIQKGWLPCDGAQYATSGAQAYVELYNAIGTSFGGDKVQQVFNVPDLRGRFVRGVNGDAKNGDPDAATRTQIAPGGYPGNRVGSVQEDALQGDRHTTNTINGDREGHLGGGVVFKPKYNVAWVGGIPTFDTRVTPRISSETRPKNVYVHWIIKARSESTTTP
jgi:hypothetical protein